MGITEKIEAVEFGERAEGIVANEYIKRGYAILARRWKMGKTEIDLIAQKEDEIIMIEVKARTTDYFDPNEAVTPDKRRRMIRAADTYIKSMKGDYSYRFDIAALVQTPEGIKMEILEDAFTSADLF